MTPGPTDGKCANPAGGPGGMPLALRLSEGLGPNETLVERLRKCLPTVADGPDANVCCSVRGDDVRMAVVALEAASAQLHRQWERMAQLATPACEPPPRWWTCATHGDAMPQNAWGCPECVREMRDELATLRRQVKQADERGNEALRRAHKAEAQLAIAARGLKHCAGWNISEDTRNALMAVVLESETLLGLGA